MDTALRRCYARAGITADPQTHARPAPTLLDLRDELRAAGRAARPGPAAGPLLRRGLAGQPLLRPDHGAPAAPPDRLRPAPSGAGTAGRRHVSAGPAHLGRGRARQGSGGGLSA